MGEGHLRSLTELQLVFKNSISTRCLALVLSAAFDEVNDVLIVWLSAFDHARIDAKTQDVDTLSSETKLPIVLPHTSFLTHLPIRNTFHTRYPKVVLRSPLTTHINRNSPFVCLDSWNVQIYSSLPHLPIGGLLVALGLSAVTNQLTICLFSAQSTPNRVLELEGLKLDKVGPNKKQNNRTLLG